MQLIGLFILCLSLIGCQTKTDDLKIGTIAGPEAELVQVAKGVALKRYGLNVGVIEFTDYNLPNEALNDGSLDANIYQHLPYLKAATKARGYRFAVIGKTFVYPTGIYSNKAKSIDSLRDRAIIVIPNDPSNEARALLLLQRAGLITLKNKEPASIQDIQENPRKLIIKELDAAQLPRVLNDVDAAVINTNFAIPAGLSPHQDAIFIEDKASPYANLIVIRKDSAKKSQLEQFVKAFHSQEVKAKAKELFGEGAIPTW